MDNSKTTLGQKIRKYRLRSGKSQLELELETGLSTGTMSRIESDSINPTKETLGKISLNLGLNSFETASLFDIPLMSDFTDLLDVYLSLSDSVSLNEVLQKSVDEVVFKLNFYSAFITLIKGDRLYAQTATNNDSTKISMGIIGKVFNTIYVSMHDTENFMVKSIVENKAIFANSTTPYVKNAVSELTAKIIDNVHKVKSCVALPISHKGIMLGAIMFGKQSEEGFGAEVELLEKYSEVLGRIIYKYSKNG